nr:hypothetical protein [Marinithermofilum abyssi]
MVSDVKIEQLKSIEEHIDELSELLIQVVEVGRSLMQKAEERVKQEGRSLLVLDTREGDPSNHLYTSMGYIRAGRIPNYAKSANGELHATIFYYKQLI